MAELRPGSRLWVEVLLHFFAIILMSDDAMQKFDERTAANLDVVLDNICRRLPSGGGDHESRKFIARKRLQAA